MAIFLLKNTLYMYRGITMSTPEVELNTYSNAINNSDYVSSPIKEEKTELNYFLDNEEQKDDDSLSPQEYMAKLQNEKQEFNEVMQLLQNAYWLKLRAEDGDPYAIEQLNSLDLGDGEYSNSANQAIFNDVVNIKAEGLELVANDDNSLDEQALYNLIAQNNPDMTDVEIKETIEKIAIGY